MTTTESDHDHHIKTPTTNGTETVAPYLPDVTGLSNADAAEEYAKARCHIVPTRPGDIKNPGRYVGLGWPKLATDDLDTVRDWWTMIAEMPESLCIPARVGFLVFDPRLS